LDADATDVQQAQTLYGLATGTTTQQAVNVTNDPNHVDAQGVIISSRPTGTMVDGKTEMELHIMVTRPDGTQYEAAITKNVPQVALPQLVAGSIVQVSYLPTDEQYLVLSINAGTIATAMR